MIKYLKPSIIALGIAAASFAGGYAYAQQDGHDGHGRTNSSMPQEAGQSAFAAIAEIVQILDADADVDWSKVNIAQLREHLVDMNSLTLGAEVTVETMGDSFHFNVSGSDAKTIRALQNMVPAHSKELDKMSEWSAKGEMTATGAILKITPTQTNSVVKIQALGFFGLMATGAHHQPHHLGMAAGTISHQH